MIGAIHEQGFQAARPRSTAAPPPPRASWVPAITLPTPRAAAAGVLAMLAFGVLVGSVGRPLQSLASSQLLVAVSRPPAQTATTPQAAAGSADSSGGGGTTTVITRTVVGAPPATSAPASGAAPSGAPAAAPVTPGGGGAGPSQNLYGLPPIHHVFIIVLSDEGFGQTFAPTSADRFLSKDLTTQGELITNYYSVAGSPLANRIALISGQGPTPQTIQNCPVYAAIKPGTRKAGQVLGTGCVYPAATQTLAGELTAAHHTWKAYVEGIDTAPNGQQTSCRHPTLGATDAEHAPRVKDPYVTWSNPFVYFTAMTSGTDCLDNDVGLDALQYDVRTGSQAPTVSFILPSACHGGSADPCAPGAPAGLAPADAFVRATVAEIKKSSAYKDNGLIVVTSDEAPQSGLHADPSACCNTPAYPNVPHSTGVSASTTSTTLTPVTTSTESGTTTTTTTPAGSTTTTTSTTASTPPAGATGQTTPTGGGGQVGLVLISRFVKPGTQDLVDYYNHYSLLATIENLFSLKRLGYAGNLELPMFDSAIFNAH